MCGLAGFLSSDCDDARILAKANTMADTLDHRGPDDRGAWCDAAAGFAVAHRRLSVVDLSPGGHQPMVSHSGRHVLAYNGEIYNHVELRRRLEAQGNHPAWRGHSDTETLLACIEAWGIEAALKSCVGMFAFALWDREERRLTLARDRMGEKPLYYGWQGDTFLFGSELKALRAHPAFDAAINRDALTLLLRHNCIPAPHSIYESVFKLPPGSLLHIPFKDQSAPKDLRVSRYWRFNSAIADRMADPFSGSENEAIDALETQLAESIGLQMLADVPLGALLSGGIDSSTVVALMQAQSDRPVRTFTVGFSDSRYDEAKAARAVADHLQTEHTELYVQPADALALIPSLPSMYCEPFGDSSQIPTYLVSQLARKQVTVALSGDAGDELFAGYNRYLMAQRTLASLQKWPKFARRSVARGLLALRPSTWNTIYGAVGRLLPKHLQIATPGDKAHKLASVLPLSTGPAYYRALTSHWSSPGEIVIAADEPETLLTNPEAWPATDSLEQFMMAMDSQTYLPDDILVKIDRAAMANSLESRVPFLDHRVVELAWRMPMSLKIREGQGKWLLRQVLYRHAPAQLFERPKMGFAVPLDGWLRRPLRDWGESLLDEQQLRADGFFHAAPIRKMWAEHLSGKSNWQHHLWTILMFQAWLEQQRQQ